jgi:DNA-binding transcriptional LysR family regulator
MDSLAGLESFARVVESGSFTSAAARLQTAKSSVSDSVRALEERLGVRLLERTTRRVRPTEAGRLRYTRC